MSNKLNAKQEINGVEYTFQKLPVMETMKLRQEFLSSTGGFDMSKMAPLVLEHFVVHPKVKIEDFKSLEELDEVVQAAWEFAYKGK